MTPAAFDQLVVCGFLGALPRRLRRPVIAPQVLLDRKHGHVLLPPFDHSEGLVRDAQAILTAKEFAALCERGEATELEPDTVARSDGCFYFRAGERAPEYTSYSRAASRLEEYADVQVGRGDRLLRAGDEEGALRCYESASAVSQHPDHYARMLLVPLPERRRARIMQALAEVSLDPQVHIDRARHAVHHPGKKARTIFGSA